VPIPHNHQPVFKENQERERAPKALERPDDRLDKRLVAIAAGEQV
jgi:hypothetical protein